MALKRRNKVSPDFSMSSMTDIVFLLLIFFMITSTLISPNALKLLLPRSKNQVQAEKPIVTVSIKQVAVNDFKFAIGQNFISFNNLETELRKQLINEKTPTISLHVDRSVPMEQVVKVMNIAKNNKYKLILATMP